MNIPYTKWNLVAKSNAQQTAYIQHWYVYKRLTFSCLHFPYYIEGSEGEIISVMKMFLSSLAEFNEFVGKRERWGFVGSEYNKRGLRFFFVFFAHKVRFFNQIKYHFCECWYRSWNNSSSLISLIEIFTIGRIFPYSLMAIKFHFRSSSFRKMQSNSFLNIHTKRTN